MLADVDAPAILHWQGVAFDPALAGYWMPNLSDFAPCRPTAHRTQTVRRRPRRCGVVVRWVSDVLWRSYKGFFRRHLIGGPWRSAFGSTDGPLGTRP